jgi:hypothetical protein
VEDEQVTFIAIESILLHADSPEKAHEKAEALCTSPEHVYRNAEGKTVRQRYVGVHELECLQVAQLHDELVLQVRAVPRLTPYRDFLCRQA